MTFFLRRHIYSPRPNKIYSFRVSRCHLFTIESAFMTFLKPFRLFCFEISGNTESVAREMRGTEKTERHTMEEYFSLLWFGNKLSTFFTRLPFTSMKLTTQKLPSTTISFEFSLFAFSILQILSILCIQSFIEFKSHTVKTRPCNKFELYKNKSL